MGGIKIKFGYIRVSTVDQNLDRQIEMIKQAGVHSANIWSEKGSGIKKKKELEKLLEIVEPGDELIITSFSRLSRSLKELIEISEFLNEKGVNLISLKENIDTSSPSGRLYFNIISSLSQFERELIVERTKEGLDAARKNGKVLGRPKTSEDKKAQMKLLHDAGLQTKEILMMCGVSRATYFRVKKEWNNEVKK